MNAAETGSGNEDAARFHDSLADPARFIPIRTGPTAKARLACQVGTFPPVGQVLPRHLSRSFAFSGCGAILFETFSSYAGKKRGSRSNRPKPHRPIAPPSSNQRRGTETGTQRVVDAISSSPANSSGLERRANLQSKKELRAEQLSRSTEELQEEREATAEISYDRGCAHAATIKVRPTRSPIRRNTLRFRSRR